MDSSNNLVVAGYTNSPNFPILNPLPGGATLQPGTCGQAPDTAPCSDGFITKLKADGSGLVDSTYFGGSGDDMILNLFSDAKHSYFVGQTDSANFPTENPAQTSLGSSGVPDAFVIRLLSSISTAVSVNAASYNSNFVVAPESLVASFGEGLTRSVSIAGTIPLPTALDGVSVKIKDSQGVERLAPLVFTSPGQINYVIPAGTASGPANFSATLYDVVLATGSLRVATVAPGLFAANAAGSGVATGLALRVKADGSLSYESIIRGPLDLGPATDQVFLILRTYADRVKAQ